MRRRMGWALHIPSRVFADRRAAVVLPLVMTLVVVIAAAGGWMRVAVAALAVLAGSGLVVAVGIQRQLAALESAVRKASVAPAADPRPQLDRGMRRVLAAVEGSRLEAFDHQAAVLTALDRSSETAARSDVSSNHAETNSAAPPRD